MIDSHIKYIDSPLTLDYSTGTVTILDLLRAICKKFGWTLKTTDFANANKVITEDKYAELTDFTYRDILDEIAATAGGFIKIINKDLYVAYPTETGEKIDENDLEKLAQTKGEITGLATGWYDFDKLTAGLHENEFIIIAARPAMGKTAFALNLATHIAMNNDKSVALFNLEMGAEQLAMRILSSLGQIEGYKLRTGNLLNNDWKRINEATSQLADTNLFIDDTPGITIGEIRAKCRRLASSEKGLGIVIIDYLQLISGGKNYGTNRQQEVSDISRSLKTLAMELHVPVIALAQLSRGVEAREDKRPIMSDLRESGSIEQDADIVSFLYRDDYYNKEARREDDISISELIIGKHRNGPTATIELLFKKNTSTFSNYSKEEE